MKPWEAYQDTMPSDRPANGPWSAYSAPTGPTVRDDEDQVSRRAQRESRLPEGNALTGLTDAIVTMGTGMVAKPVSDVVGLGAMLGDIGGQALGLKPGDVADPRKVQQRVQGALTIDPSTQAGVTATTSNWNPVVAVGNALHWAGEKAGNLVREPGEPATDPRNMVANAIQEAVIQSPVIAGALLPKVAPRVGGALEGAGREKMYEAINPNQAARESGRGADAASFMVEEGYNATHGGRAKMKGRVQELQADISQITNTSTNSISRQNAIRHIYDVFDKYDNALDAHGAWHDVATVMNQFLAHPNWAGRASMPVSAAQEMKALIYKDNANAYRPGTPQKSSPTVDAEKALARGLKEEIARAEPQVSLLNAEESQLLNALQVTKRMSTTEGRIADNLSRHPFLVHALLKHPKLATAVMLNKSPAFKSMWARLEFNLGKAVRAAGGSDTKVPLAADAATSEAERLPLAQQLLLPSPSSTMSLSELMPR